MKNTSDIVDDQLFRKLVWQSIAIMFVLFAIVTATALFFRAPITELAVTLVDHLGPLGIFFGVLAADGLTLPIPPTTYVFVAVAAEIPIIPALSAAFAASLIGGSLAYFVGPFLTKLPLLGHRIEAFRPRGQALFERWGMWTIAISAITPLPFSITCWFAGIYRMPFRRFFAISLIRAPRILVYYALFVLGWSATI